MTSSTKRPTFSREAWEGAQRAWAAGDFSDEWRHWRHLAAMTAGIIRPPQGTKWDSWGDDQPSERAILIRAIRDTPEALTEAIRSPGVHSWSAVIAILIRGRDGRMSQIEQDERDDARRRAEEDTPRQATRTIRDILDVIGGS